jgi:MarR family transcriptional regulator, organic hydroperoxide resistance regulator
MVDLVNEKVVSINFMRETGSAVGRSVRIGSVERLEAQRCLQNAGGPVGETFRNEESLGYIIIRTAIWLRKMLNQHIREAGLDVTIEEFRILNQLAVDGPLPLGMLAAKSVKDKSTVTRFVNKMVEKGLVERTRDAQDGRVYHVALTAEGHRINQTLHTPSERTIAVAKAGISEAELARTLAIMVKMFENLDARLTERDLGDA